MSGVRKEIYTRVNRASIRREMKSGREHFVVSSYTLPANVVMNGLLYPAEQIDAHYPGIEGTLAPLGHPKDEAGEFIRANTAEAINSSHVGAWNRNVRKVGNRIHAEKWIDIGFANNTEGGKVLISRLEALERGDKDAQPIHTSIALLLREVPLTDGQKKLYPNAQAVAEIVEMDHDAILLDEPGAATPEQGVGMMVNADAAMISNATVVEAGADSYRNRERGLDDAARARFTGPDAYPWIADFGDDWVIIGHDGETEQFSYTRENGIISLGQTGVPVVRKDSWLAVVATNIRNFFNRAESPKSKEGDDMPITAEERAEIVAANTAATTEALKPLMESVTALADTVKSMQTSMTANARAAEDTMRAELIAAGTPEVVANALQGEALTAMHKTLGRADTLAGNSGAKPTGDADKFDINDLPA